MEPDQVEQPSIEEKEEQIKKQKSKFVAVVKIFKTVIVGVLVLSILIVVIKKITTQVLPPVVIDPEPPQEEPIETDSTKDNVETTLYNSDELKVSFEYPINARIEEDLESEHTKKVEIIYDEEGKEGYIFRVSTFTTEARNLDEVAKVKRDSFVTRCPETAKVSGITETLVDTVEAREFSVMNCDAHYEITYTPRFFKYYEFARVYKGDYGYWQQYKKIAADILDSVRFYPEEVDPQPDLPYKIYTSDKYKISFKHPKLSQECCNITGPRMSSVEMVVSLYQPSTYKNNAEYNGIGVFVDLQEERDQEKLSYEVYMKNEKQKLTDDYVIIRGKAPDTAEKDIKLGEFDAILLTGYTWEGNDLIYSEISNDGGKDKKIVIIAIKNITGEDFEKETVELLLESFEYIEEED